MIFNLVWLPARQTGSSTRTKVLLRIMLRDTTVCEDDLVKQALSNSGAAMTTQRCAVIGITILTLASSSGLGFAAGNERGNRGMEQQTIQTPNGASVRIFRGRPSSAVSVEHPAPPTVPQAEPWVVGGDRLWIVDTQ